MAEKKIEKKLEKKEIGKEENLDIAHPDGKKLLIGCPRNWRLSAK